LQGLIMVFKQFQNHRDHVSPHRIWAHLYCDGELNTKEYDHLVACERCLSMFVLCLKSETFGAFLKRLRDSVEERRSA
jgi:hypothetical protein